MTEQEQRLAEIRKYYTGFENSNHWWMRSTQAEHVFELLAMLDQANERIRELETKLPVSNWLETNALEELSIKAGAKLFPPLDNEATK